MIVDHIREQLFCPKSQIEQIIRVRTSSAFGLGYLVGHIVCVRRSQIERVGRIGHAKKLWSDWIQLDATLAKLLYLLKTKNKHPWISDII
uniref:Uncharacterized protein n=1 Tax=Romanomermis culicivorax TaxID=13658 RepID=A0A915JVA7_ROMCU